MISKKYLAFASIAFAILGSSAIAQTGEAPAPKKQEHIIIKKKGDKNEKMTIVVDGDKVTINGKPLEQFDGDVRILKGDQLSAGPGARAFAMPGFEGQNGAFGKKRALLGVVTEKADEGGARVTEITKESGAAKAGLKENDIITKVGDKKIETSTDLIAAIGERKPNEQVEITYKRGGKEAKTTATLGETSGVASFRMNEHDFNFDFPRALAPLGETWSMSRKPRIGLQIQDLEEGSGVKVNDVDDDTPAEKAGLKEGDVITHINGKAVAGVDEVRAAIKDVKEGDTVKMTYKRGNSSKQVDLKIPKHVKKANL